MVCYVSLKSDITCQNLNYLDVYGLLDPMFEFLTFPDSVHID